MGNAYHYIGRRHLGNRVTIPERAGPHVKLVFAEMARQKLRYWDLEGRSGVRVACFKAWRHKNRPSWEGLTAALNSLGWDLTPVPRGGVIPTELEASLLELAERFGKSIPETFSALLTVQGRQQLPTAGVDPLSRWEA